MKALSIFILLLSISSSSLLAQSLDSVIIKGKNYYIGLGLSSNYYLLNYKKNTEPAHSSTFIANPYFNLGYKLNKRISIQIGGAYANDKEDSYDIYFGGTGNIIEYHFNRHTRGLVLPLTARLIFLNARGKLPIYGTASIIPAYARTTIRKTEVKDNNTTTTFIGHASGINTFFTAGLGFNFLTKKRFNGYAEVLLLNRNASGENIDPLRFERFSVYRHLGMGFTYNFIKPKSL